MKLRWLILKKFDEELEQHQLKHHGKSKQWHPQDRMGAVPFPGFTDRYAILQQETSPGVWDDVQYEFE